MKTFNSYVNEDNINPAFSHQGSVTGPGLGQYDPQADLNAQTEKEVKKSDLDQIERYADRLFASLGIDVEFTRHFLDRVNDERNVKQITPSELTRLFKQTYKKHGKVISKLGPDAEAVINDMKTNINMPFVLNLKGGELELVAKTVMRKKNFKTPNRKLSFESYITEARAKKAVAGGKVQKLVTAFGYSFKGKNYKEIDMELVGIDNSSQIVTFNIIHPKEIFGNEIKIPFKTLRRGRYMATDTSKIWKEDKEDDELQKTMKVATAKMQLAKQMKNLRRDQKSLLDRTKDKERKKELKVSQNIALRNLKTNSQKQLKIIQKEEVELDERNYASEYKNYHSKPEQIARRSSRNKARRLMGDKVVKGMDVGHKDNDPMNNDPKNLRNENPSDNRREPRLRETSDKFKFFTKDAYKLVTLPKPPSNRERELEILKKIMAARTEKDEESIKNHDENPFHAIKVYCKEKGLEFHDGEMEELLKDISPTIHHFKEKFKVKRPFEIDSSIKPMDSKTNKTASYPSGHATQSTIIAKYITHKFPTHERGIMAAAKECGMGRVQAGFHFLSDYITGNLLGEKLFMIMNKDSFK